MSKQNSPFLANGNNSENAAEPIQAPKHRYVPLAEMHGAERNLRIFNFCLSAAILLACLSWAVYRLALNGFSDIRFLSSIGLAAVAVLPFVAERIFKIIISNFIILAFLVFLFFAGFLGSGLGLYYTWSFFYYDKIVHGFFGYLAAVAALYLICKLSDYSKSKAVFVALFCFSVSLCCAAVWEIWEFSCDRIVGSTAQGGIPVGEQYASVADTMGDIITNFVGAILFLIHFILHRTTKKNLLIGSMVQDFTSTRYGQPAKN